MIDKLHLDTAHWTGRGHLRGKTHDWARKMPLAQILVKNSPYFGGTFKLKAKLLRENRLDLCCSQCGIKEWRARRLEMHLDHVNGNRQDNRLENLRLLCPNCHSQTETYCGKNKGSYRDARRANARQVLAS